MTRMTRTRNSTAPPTKPRRHFARGAALFAVALAAATVTAAVPAGAAPNSFISHLSHVTTLASTVPQNGDVNPYGVAVVSRTIGDETAGHILVSNFNNSANEQGTGTTIVDISPWGTESLFARD